MREMKFPFSRKVSKGICLGSLVSLFIVAQALPSRPIVKAQNSASGQSAELFESKVRPTLQAKCYACHGPKQQLAGLRLDKAVPANLAPVIAEAGEGVGEREAHRLHLPERRALVERDREERPTEGEGEERRPLPEDAEDDCR